MNKVRGPVTAYISIPIRHEKESYLIESMLEGIGIGVNNPCRIEEARIPTGNIPPYVTERCFRMIDESDIGVLHLDYFGNDCACEIGYMKSQKKPMYGVHVREIPEVKSLEELGRWRASLDSEFRSLVKLRDFLLEKY